MTFPQQITRYECPIESCDWKHDDAGPDEWSEGSGPTIEEAAFSVLKTHLAGVEAIVKAHLETHPLMDWVNEVMRLHAKVQGGTPDAALVVAVLVHKLGGGVYISDGDLLDHSGKLLQREPVSHGFVLSVAEPSTGTATGASHPA